MDQVDERERHLQGLAQLMDREFRDEFKRRMFGSAKDRKRWLERHVHAEPFVTALEPEKGSRSPTSLIMALRNLGSGPVCYVIATDDSSLDDTFQPIGPMIERDLYRLDHLSILSCVPGKLALIRTPWPHRQLIATRSP